MKEENRSLPFYTKGEEIFNAVSHIVGGAFGIFVVVFSLIYGLINKVPTINLISMLIYGVSIIILYTMSSIYHFLRRNKAKKVFRIFDHCTIYLLIAGTYTPICLIGLKGNIVGIIIFIIQWTLAIIGITFNAINMHNKYVKIFSMIFYILMGWCAIAFFNSFITALSVGGFMYILIGGILYTIGVVFFAFGSKVRYIHSVWHLFVLFGTIVQFLGILLYLYM